MGGPNAQSAIPVAPPANVIKPTIQNSAPPKVQNKPQKPVKKGLADIFGG